MQKIIHKIRAKKHHEKDRIIWISAALAIGVMLLIWGIVGNGRKTTPDDNFFQTFNKNIEAGKDTVPADPLAQ